MDNVRKYKLPFDDVTFQFKKIFLKTIVLSFLNMHYIGP